MALLVEVSKESALAAARSAGEIAWSRVGTKRSDEIKRKDYRRIFSKFFLGFVGEKAAALVLPRWLVPAGHYDVVRIGKRDDGGKDLVSDANWSIDVKAHRGGFSPKKCLYDRWGRPRELRADAYLFVDMPVHVHEVYGVRFVRALGAIRGAAVVGWIDATSLKEHGDSDLLDPRLLAPVSALVALGGLERPENAEDLATTAKKAYDRALEPNEPGESYINLKPTSRASADAGMESALSRTAR